MAEVTKKTKSVDQGRLKELRPSEAYLEAFQLASKALEADLNSWHQFVLKGRAEDALRYWLLAKAHEYATHGWAKRRQRGFRIIDERAIRADQKSVEGLRFLPELRKLEGDDDAARLAVKVEEDGTKCITANDGLLHDWVWNEFHDWMEKFVSAK